MNTKTSIEPIDPVSLVKARSRDITTMENMIHNDFMDMRGANDKVLDIQDGEGGYKIVTVERIVNEKKTTHQIVVYSDKIILRDRQDIDTEIVGDNDFFVASYRIYTGGEYTRGNYIKDIKNDKVLTRTFEASNITDIHYDKDMDIYTIEGTEGKNTESTTRLFNKQEGILDKGSIELVDKDIYVNRVGRIYDHETVRDVAYTKLEKNEQDTCTKKVLFQRTERPTDYAKHKDNCFRYMGDGIVIESAPRGGKNVPSHSYDGEFGQATDIFSEEQKQSPEYTGKLFYISKDVFGVRPQIFPEKDSLYSPRTHKFRAPYINFVRFDGSLLAQKPYYDIKKIGDAIFAKPVRKDMIEIADSMKTTAETIAQEHTEVDKQYMPNEVIKGSHERMILDPQTLDPKEDDEIFFHIQKKNGYIYGVKTNNEIVIYGKDGTRKADSIVSYITLQDQIFECTLTTGGKVYYDNQWNKIDL